MATIHAKPPAHSRHRSASDPFSDPVYTLPHLQHTPRSAHAPRDHRSQPSSHRPARTSSRNDSNMATVAAQARPPEPPRSRMHRSQTSVPAAADGRPSHQSKRSMSQDSVVRAAAAIERTKSTSRRTGKTGSTHADVIDRLDFSGVGPMFHHDGPFDACAPSRNRHRTKAPMLAWASGTNPDQGVLEKAYTPAPHEAPYPAAQRTRGYEPTPVIPYEPPKKKHDALAEAWGTHEPEPYEEFFAGGGGGHSRPGSTHSRGSTPVAASFTGRRSKEQPRDLRERFRDEDAQPALRRSRERRPTIPPPQPIFVPEADADDDAPPSPTAYGYGAAPRSPGGTPKRSKSLMQRIRKMRENPNVPAGAAAQDAAYESDAAAAAPVGGYPQRPGHRSQKSFLGRIAGRGEDAFVYVDDPKNKELPSAPPVSYPAETPRSPNAADGYFDDRYAGGTGTTPGAGLGRKTSLMKKAKGLMRGGK